MDGPAPRRPAATDLEGLRWHVHPDVEGAQQQGPAPCNHTGGTASEGGARCCAEGEALGRDHFGQLVRPAVDGGRFQDELGQGVQENVAKGPALS